MLQRPSGHRMPDEEGRCGHEFNCLTFDIEVFTFLAEASGFEFHVATCNEGVFTSQ
ncbi:hypothetical protein BV353_04147 [Pseudomonas syringae pv. actinidiae]|nr:hypothetical protein BV353_04147 [Pseudomonas syringae pv. actinidiae]